MEEMALKSKGERMELQAQLDEANGKLKALRDAEEQGDGINEYLASSKEQPADQSLPDLSALDYAHVMAVPKTPLQRTVRHLQSSSRDTAISTTNQPQQHGQINPTPATDTVQPQHGESNTTSATDSVQPNRQRDLAEKTAKPFTLTKKRCTNIQW